MIESTPGSYLNTSSAKWFAISFFLFALLVGAIQPRPVDAFPRSLPPSIPLVAAGFLSDTHALTAQEQRYFTRYGGSATRASFGPFGLLLVNTQSPLRHLHDPTICLRGAGFEVDFLGTDHGTHSAIYKASRQANDHESVEPTAQYLVRVSYQSNHGQLASSVSQAIWYWLRDPSSSWTMVQRITPLNPSIDPGLAHEWEQAMRRAYNLT